ncbi:MAG: hypothetical protein E6Q97_10920 [Desulfurellales bacterium]|nr:MAG: hypothetical protein E6Q97_10920 [Desulfurellales bacterium]
MSNDNVVHITAHDLPVALTRAADNFGEGVFALIDEAVERGVPIEMLIGRLTVISTALVQGVLRVEVE